DLAIISRTRLGDGTSMRRRPGSPMAPDACAIVAPTSGSAHLRSWPETPVPGDFVVGQGVRAGVNCRRIGGGHRREHSVKTPLRLIPVLAILLAVRCVPVGNYGPDPKPKPAAPVDENPPVVRPPD